jgi:hypothetical protein
VSITTKSLFFYGHEIDETNFSWDFSEGGAEIQGSLNIGDYTLTEFAAEIERAMNAVGGQEYTVTVDRATRKITITAPGNFELLVDSGSRKGSSAYALAGFSGADKTGSDTYEGGSASGFEYRPQAVFMDYEPFEDDNGAIDASVNKTVTGIVETVTFGTERMMQCRIWGITDESISNFDNNPSGRADARAFRDYAIRKLKMEFMEDRDTPGTFTKVLLEKTPEEGNGTRLKLKKMFDTGVEGIYETGKITFREVA